MMDFEKFKNEAVRELKGRMDDGEKISIRRVVKNNGTVLTGVYIMRKGETAAPIIYLEPMYQLVKQGAAFACVMDEAVSLVKEKREAQELGEDSQRMFEELWDYSKMKERLAYKLIQTKGNAELLASVPSIPYLDLSIVFELCWEDPVGGCFNILVTNEMKRSWNVLNDELKKQADINTPQLRPACLYGMRGEEMREIAEEEPLLKKGPWMYILTNKQAVHGAAAILYEGELKSMADRLGADLFVLPSSIHETILFPDTGCFKAGEINELIRLVNETEVPLEDQLSGHAYRYIRQEDRLEAA